VKFTRLVLLTALLCLGGIALTSGSSLSGVGWLRTVSSNTTLARGTLREIPWKATSHRFGMRRSTEPVQPLLLSPGTSNYQVVDTSVPEDSGTSIYQHQSLPPRELRGPPSTHL
jgi:hypothetical protein